MPFYLIRQDITKLHVDAIVNAANNSLLGGGGVDGAIHRAAGPELLAECRTLGGCRTGEAKRTGAYALPCRYVIHTVGPIWHGGTHGERELLRSCYLQSLTLAVEADCESVAFPMISSGAYGYPKEQAFEVASQAIRDFLQTYDLTVYLVVFNPWVVMSTQDHFSTLRRMLMPPEKTEVPAARQLLPHLSRKRPAAHRKAERANASEAAQDVFASQQEAVFLAPMQAPDAALSLESMLSQLDESFSQMLLRLIDERGITDAQCYKRANVDRKLFSKIRTNPQYRPSKNTVIAFAIALELPMEQTRELLTKAGYALSHSTKSDIIIEYYIQQGQYDIFAINEALFAFDQALLGG